MKKSVSTVVATVIMLVITIGLMGSAWVFVSGIFTRTAYVLEIVDAYQGSITLRNSGNANLSLGSIKVYVDNVEIGFMSDKDSIPPGDTATLTILNQIPVGIWHFDEGAGTIAYDSSGNNNNGNLVNGPTWVDGKFGKALSFDGIDDYVVFRFDMNYTDFTFCFWFYLPYVINNPMLFGSESLTGFGYFVSDTRYGKGILFAFRSSDTNEWGGVGIDTGVSQVGKWNFACMVRKDTLLTAYFNEYKGTNNDGRSGRAFRFNIRMGLDWNWGGGRGTPRIIDEVRIYNRALSEEEIKNLYQKGPTERKNIRIVYPGKVINSFMDIEENNPTGISDWYSKVGRNTGKGINLCGWSCEEWINVKPDNTWIRGKYASPVSSNWGCPPSQNSGYIACCYCDDPSLNCGGCEITVWFKKFLVIPTTANKVWLRYSTDDPIRIYVDGNLFYERGCCCNPCPDIELTPAITKGKGNWITTKFYEGCWCGYFGGNIWYT